MDYLSITPHFHGRFIIELPITMYRLVIISDTSIEQPCPVRILPCQQDYYRRGGSQQTQSDQSRSCN
ncbi:hypothetical protein FGO68_gene13264 [Halteria grandinella]|uniref:Uncharacterized protein n=1 Tax=Halteria grandinella TaxID=5974 RepID=A0A8J8SVR9_HALGN|nr:hypothetical protein FGO68_gene13264 [Halteria grandinella]